MIRQNKNVVGHTHKQTKKAKLKQTKKMLPLGGETKDPLLTWQKKASFPIKPMTHGCCVWMKISDNVTIIKDRFSFSFPVKIVVDLNFVTWYYVQS